MPRRIVGEYNAGGAFCNIDVAFCNIMRYTRHMANGNDVDKLLAEAAERLRKEAYAAGWRDAIAAITNAVAGLANQDVGDAGEMTETTTDLVSNKSGSALTPGGTPWYVLQAIKKRRGMTGAEVVSVVQEGGHKVPEGSIRTSLSRLKARKLIVSRHGKWFPA